MNFILAFLVGFVLCVTILPFVIKLGRRLKFGQNILHYVESHASKQGTPTMGGISFIFAGLIAGLIFLNKSYSFAVVALSIYLGYGILGFLDDFIKVKYKRNLGLRAYQKIIGQVSLSLIVAFFVYFNKSIPNAIILPFSDIRLELGWMIIPFITLLLLATTNSINLTDGLDGLAAGTTMVYLLGFSAVCYLYTQVAAVEMSPYFLQQNTNIITICLAVAGSLLGFLAYNGYPAKVFMGDTGSLALGAIVGVSACFNGLGLYIIIMGFMFVLSALSVIIQVLHYKRTKRRVFLMAPLHHHFEKKGVNENRIVTIYIIITVILVLLSVLLTISLR